MDQTDARKLNQLMRSILTAEQQVYDQRARQADMTLPQARTLGYIARHPGLNQREIADHFHRRGASMSSMLKLLERDGLIEKHAQQGTQDRSKRIFLTPAGKSKVNILQSIFDNLENQLTQNLTATESTQLITLLQKINRPQN